MSESKYQLPPRKWYTLQQTVKRIQQLTGEELEISDLLHYWVTGRINIATNIYFSSSCTINSLSDNSTSLSIKDIPSKGFILGNNEIKMKDLSYYTISNNIDSFQSNSDYCNFRGDFFIASGWKRGTNEQLLKNNNITSNYNINNIDTFKLLKASSLVEIDDEEEDLMNYSVSLLKGLVYIGLFGNANVMLNNFYSFERKIVKEGIYINNISNFFQYDSEKEQFISFFIDIDGSYKLSVDELYITEVDLMAFLNNQEILSPSNKSKETSRTIKENQINFIKGLLYLHYDIKNPNEAKNAMNTGKLGQDIARLKREQPNIEEEQNFKFPTGVSLFNWYSKS